MVRKAIPRGQRGREDAIMVHELIPKLLIEVQHGTALTANLPQRNALRWVHPESKPDADLDGSIACLRNGDRIGCSTSSYVPFGLGQFFELVTHRRVVPRDRTFFLARVPVLDVHWFSDGLLEQLPIGLISVIRQELYGFDGD